MARHLSPASRICSPIQLAQGVDGNQLAGGVVIAGSATP